MNFPKDYKNIIGEGFAEGAARYGSIAQGKLESLMRLRDALKSHRQYQEDFSDLFWLMQRVAPLYRKMAESTAKFAPALTGGGNRKCSREQFAAILEREAAFTQVEIIVKESIALAEQITASYKDEVLQIVDWDDVL